MSDSGLHHCERCGGPTRAGTVFFKQNISYLVARREETFCGRACLACMTRIFLKFTLTTLLLTWFGIVGAALGPCYIIANIGEYILAVARMAVGRRPQPNLPR